MPTDLFLQTILLLFHSTDPTNDIFAVGGASVPTQEKKKTDPTKTVDYVFVPLVKLACMAYHSVHTSPPLSAGEGGEQKGGLDRTSTFRGGGC